MFSCQGSYSQVVEKTEYIFPKEVNKALNEKVNWYKKNNPEWSLYLTLSRVTWVEERGNYLISIGTYKNKPIDVIEKLISKSIHCYYSDSMQISIIFDYDFAFTGYGTDNKGRVVRKNVTGGNDFFIEFTQQGEVIRTEN